MKRLAPVLMICLMAASAAHGQSGGGRRGGKGRGGASPTSTPTPTTGTAPAKASDAPDKVAIVGVVTAIDAQADRITIDCEAADGLSLPAGPRTFVASKHALVTGATVGEKVRFHLESQQISDLNPF